jgi:hypothetical protein
MTSDNGKQIATATTSARAIKGITIVVATVPFDSGPQWGYTLWQGCHCLEGRSHPEWDAARATEEAERQVERRTRPRPTKPYGIVHVNREDSGRFCVTLENTWEGSHWLGIYAANGQLIRTIWHPAVDVPKLDPAELARLADAV